MQALVDLISELQALAESKGLVTPELRQRISETVTAAVQQPAAETPPAE